MSVLLQVKAICDSNETRALIRTASRAVRPGGDGRPTRFTLLNAASCESSTPPMPPRSTLRQPDCNGPYRNNRMNAERLPECATDLVGRRRGTYGQLIELFEQVATRWSLVLGVKVTPAQTVLSLVDLKLTRLVHDPRHLNSITDVAGYAGCLAEALGDA